MACGVHLGILLVCLVQAEHVRCLWAKQAQRSQAQNGNTYVGFLQQNSGFGGSYPQNQLRHGSISSAQRPNLETRPAASSGYNQGLSKSGNTKPGSQPTKSGYAKVRLVQSSSTNPKWQTTKFNQVDAQKAPKKFFGLSTAIASGSSVSKYDKSSKKTSAIQQPHSSKYPPSSSAYPPKESYSSRLNYQSAQTAPAAAHKSSSLFGQGAPLPNTRPVRTKTSASAPARRVSSSRGSGASKPSSFSSFKNEGNNPSQSEAWKPHQSKLFPVNAQGSYKPTSNSNMASSRVSYSQSLPVSIKQSGPLQPRSGKPTSQRLNSAEQLTGTGTSAGKLFAPTKVHKIPERFGGFPIRRLKDPVDQQESVRKPQQNSVAPQLYTVSSSQQNSVAPQDQLVSSGLLTFVAPQRQLSSSLSKQTYVPHQRQASAASSAQRTYVAPQRQAAASSAQQNYMAPQRQVASSQQASMAHEPTYLAQQQSADQKPQGKSVHLGSKWKRVKMRPNLQQ
ncbi:uncharacterized protein LOC121957792 [Plectropomus leopardus]|uniref:uncharacterized protein LOC121957792 n=1 Tax=Plectropomus leopardus TaxID=160734 RepID=UPI001C4DCB6E|nr:uncharacterized protein LOC121957792 [Plectropomus leopardus]